MSTISPNMGLIVPTVGVDDGPGWAQNLNADLSILDGHNHSPGSGVQITPSGLNINADLSFNGNNATTLRSVRFSPQTNPLSGAADLGCLYETGVDLYYNDGNGNQIQITSGGTVNATSSGIASGTNSASFSSNVLVVKASASSGANVLMKSAELTNSGNLTNILTLQAPTLSGSITETLPAIPGSTSFMQMDSSGNMSASIATSGGLSSTNIANGGVSRPNLVAVGQLISSSSGTFSHTGNTSSVTPTNLSVTITTSGRPVVLQMISDGSGNTAFISIGTTNGVDISFVRTVSMISSTIATYFMKAGTSNAMSVPSSVVSFLDTPAAGTYTYNVAVQLANSGDTVSVFYTSLLAYEL